MIKALKTKRIITVVCAIWAMAAFALCWAAPCAAAVFVGGYTLCDPLPEEYRTPIDEYVECDIEGFLTSKYDVIDAMRDFYTTTGVQPYLIITDSVEDEREPSDEAVNAYLEKRYSELFGTNGGHLLTVLLVRDEEYDVSGRFFSLAGEITSMVFDSNVDINSSFNEILDEFGFEALRGQSLVDCLQCVYWNAPEAIMQHVEFTEYRTDDLYMYSSSSSGLSEVLPVLFAVFMIPAALVIGVISRIKKEERDEQDAKDAREEMDRRVNDAVRRKLEHQAQVKKEEPKKVRYPVTCPGCGATAFPNDDGTCQYCGRWIV
ncbi:MAG: hypothetical protein IJS90_09760 [Clostridia bacterium]|nr:hypothetical protein [Clostridia bacterium]